MFLEFLGNWIPKCKGNLPKLFYVMKKITCDLGFGNEKLMQFE